MICCCLFYRPVVSNDQFSYIPWQDFPSKQFSFAIPTCNIPLPIDFHLDDLTLESLDNTYNTLHIDHDLTLRLKKFNFDVNNLNKFLYRKLSKNKKKNKKKITLI